MAAGQTQAISRNPTRHRRLPLLLAAILSCATTVLYAAPERSAAGQASATQGSVDAGWILSKLARPAPMRTGFVELRESKLLKTPLRIAGEYRRPDNDTLVREVRSPYAETTTIRAGEATIARAGHSPRTFSLSRVPELSGLQASFGALLSGNRKLLAQHYTVTSQGLRQQWTLLLKPKDADMAAKVGVIALYGRGSELRCIETRPVKGDPQRTLLAGAAREAIEIAAVAVTEAGMATLCHGAKG